MTKKSFLILTLANLFAVVQMNHLIAKQEPVASEKAVSEEKSDVQEQTASNVSGDEGTTEKITEAQNQTPEQATEGSCKIDDCERLVMNCIELAGPLTPSPDETLFPKDYAKDLPECKGQKYKIREKTVTELTPAEQKCGDAILKSDKFATCLKNNNYAPPNQVDFEACDVNIGPNNDRWKMLYVPYVGVCAQKSDANDD